MGFYLRKALRAGPLRFNLSKSGIGVSAGVPGLRLGLVGPRGTYVYAGRNGLYYRATIRRPTRRKDNVPSPATAFPTVPTQPVLDESVAGATVLQMAAAEPSELVTQLNHAQQAVAATPWAVGLGILLIAGAYWLAGFPGLLIVLPISAATWWLWHWDATRKAVVAFYDVNDQYSVNFQRLVDAFQLLTACHRAWVVEAEARVTTVHQYKVEAGASQIESRKAVRLDTEGPKPLKTNITIPSIHGSSRSVHFLPDRILIREGSSFAEVDYAMLTANTGQVRFIESEGQASDAKTVGTTWQYVNLKGGPDRRYKDNRQLPIMLYALITMAAPNGFRSSWLFSKSEGLDAFVQAVSAMAMPAQPSGWSRKAGKHAPEGRLQLAHRLPSYSEPIPPSPDNLKLLSFELANPLHQLG